METSLFHIPPPISTVPFVQFLWRIWSSHSVHALGFPPSLLWSKSLLLCESVVRKTLPAAPVDNFYRTLIISFLTTCLWATMQIYLWLCSLHPGVWLNCWVSAKFLCFSISRMELGSTTTQSNRFKNEKQCIMLYRMLKITRKMFRIWRNLLLSSNNFPIGKLPMCLQWCFLSQLWDRCATSKNQNFGTNPFRR